MLGSGTIAGASAPVSSEGSLGPTDIAKPKATKIAWEPTPTDPLSCVARVGIPAIDQAMETAWAPDGSRIAVVRIVQSSSRRTISGFEEDPRLVVLDLRNSAVQDLGEGSRPRWSDSGSYLSFWRRGHLHVVSAGSPVTILEGTVPDTRWVGDELRFILRDEIRAWSPDGGERVISRMSWDHMPRFPRDDAYFSADGALVNVTRYFADGNAFRYNIDVATAYTGVLEAPGATFTEWAPVGRALLVRSDSAVEIVGATRTAAPISGFPGTVHGWTADGSLLMGSLTPSLPPGTTFDKFAVWREGKVVATATLPNLIGSRSFSPDGRYFAGVSRAGLYETVLEIYRCGTRLSPRSDRADPVARAWQARIDGDGRRLIRPVAGYMTQFLQGIHTGVDIAASYGAMITAADDGVVTYVGWVPVGGRAVCVTHAGGLETCYYHTSISYVSVGQRVARGQAVAAIGMTGLTTGPHLHWEAKQDGRIVDPLAR